MSGDPTVAEQLIWSLAQEARSEDVAVVGVATPIANAAALLARETLAPGLTVLAGAAVDPTVHDVARPMVDASYLSRVSAGTLSQLEILDQIQQGAVTLQYVSPAQVDGRGRLNTSRVRQPDGTLLRLPGSLATADIAVLVGRLIAYRASHSPRFLVPEVDFVSGAGHDRGQWREDRQLPGSGLEAIVTDAAVLRWSAGRFELESVHEGHDPEGVARDCGFELIEPGPSRLTPSPPSNALDILRKVIDPHAMRDLEVRATRRQAVDRLVGLSTSRRSDEW